MSRIVDINPLKVQINSIKEREKAVQKKINSKRREWIEKIGEKHWKLSCISLINEKTYLKRKRKEYESKLKEKNANSYGRRGQKTLFD